MPLTLAEAKKLAQVTALWLYSEAGAAKFAATLNEVTESAPWKARRLRHQAGDYFHEVTVAPRPRPSRRRKD